MADTSFKKQILVNLISTWIYVTFLKNRVSQFVLYPQRYILVNIYLFKVNNRNTIKSDGVCSKLTIKKP